VWEGWGGGEMNIGIYLGNQLPSVGGGYSLTETIKKEILEYNGNHNLFMFYHARSRKMRWTENKITYINLWPWRIKRYFYNKILKKLGIDLMILFAPVKMEIEIPFIYTVWDLGHRMLPYFPETTSNGEFKHREEIFQYMLPRATYILTGNETGKKEILANYAINAEKIKVISFPITGFCFEKIDVPKKIDSIEEPFVFYPAQFWMHKNHIVIVEAINYLRKERDLKINCYFVGSDKNNLEYVKSFIKQKGLEERVKILGFVDYSMLMYLYKNALAMVYVSLLGPNNLPPLEAAVLGCPSINSNLPGHIEQMEGNGLFVEPMNPQEIADAIFKLYSEPNFRADMIDKGLEFAKKFKEYSYFNEVLKVVEQFGVLSRRKGL
jgi:glycosyltransferase involved in cell wall biosynthesis